MKKGIPLWVLPVLGFLCLCIGFYAGRQGTHITTTRNPDTVYAATQAPTEPLRININTATWEELTLLPGVGEAIAKDIVAYRNLHGRFTSISQLDEVKGIGEGKLAAIKDYIILEDAP